MGKRTPAKVSVLPVRLYQRLRPIFCPFDKLLEHVPTGASVLDVGCGNGVFLVMLAESGRIRAGYGVDRSRDAIRNAQRTANEKTGLGLLHFQTVDSLAEVPNLGFDVVSMVDVVHHIPKPEQLKFFVEAANKLRPGGTLIYKDISAKHKLWGLCNTLHDLAKARQFVHYVSEEQLMSAAIEAGLERIASLYVRRLCYMHFIQILHKPTLSASATHTACKFSCSEAS
jgi:2-polyprenyl-3-methyl-5-hydroxy-6-metoxy-1,4-benzoquinol methylase